MERLVFGRESTGRPPDVQVIYWYYNVKVKANEESEHHIEGIFTSRCEGVSLAVLTQGSQGIAFPLRCGSLVK